MARMTVVTKPEALAQPRRHKGKRRALALPREATSAPEVDQQTAAEDHQGNVEAAEADRVSTHERGAMGGAGNLFVEDLTGQQASTPEEHIRVAASAVTPDEVVRSFLRVRDGAAAPRDPRGGLAELIQAGLRSGAAAAPPAAQRDFIANPSAAAVRSPNYGNHANGSAAAAATPSPGQTDMPGTATGENGHGAKEVVAGNRQPPAAEPAWRMKGSAASRRDMPLRPGRPGVPEVSTDVAAQVQGSRTQTSTEQKDAQHGLQQRRSAPACAPAAAVGGPGEDSWPSLIAGLSFSAAVEAQPNAAHAAAGELPLEPEGASEAQPTSIPAAARQLPPVREAVANGVQAEQLHGASLPAPALLRGGDRFQRPAHAPFQQADRGRSGRMAELQLHAPNHGSKTSAPQATGTASAGRPSNEDFPGKPHHIAEQRRHEYRGERDRSADATGPNLLVPSRTAAALVDSRTQPAPKRSRQQNSGVPLEVSPPAAKRQRVQGAAGGGRGGSLWDLANNVMVHMAQRLMPGATAVQRAPSQVWPLSPISL